MSAPAIKQTDSLLELGQEFPLYNLLTRILIQALCPIFKSEILLGELRPVEAALRFGFWVEENLDGDLQGTIGVGAEKPALRAAANGLGLKKGSQADPAAALSKIQASLSEAIRKQFAAEDFRFQLESVDKIREDFAPAASGKSFFMCPVETKYGIFRILFSLRPSAPAVVEEFANQDVEFEPRKIRVYASQLDSVFGQIKDLESLEGRLLSGPHVRAQMRSKIKRLKRLVHQLKSEPLDMLLSPARKLVAEIGKQQGKQIAVTTQGTWLYLDKNVLNYLYEPILHLVRNAVDHGIEEISERERLGKPATGSIKCLATFGEKGLRMIVSDDGRGLDFGKIRERAVGKGWLTPRAAESKLPQDLMDYVFEAGFSTRDRADAISGRGLGLDVVRRGIEAISGTIRILSTSNHGTSFEICVPLNEDFSPSRPKNTERAAASTGEERTQLLDEMTGNLEQMTRVLTVFEKERSVSAAYETYRSVHLVRGSAGFLGWNHVVGFCHHFEDLLKLIAEGKTQANEVTVATILEAGRRLHELCDVSRAESAYSLLEIRKLEVRILQLIWAATNSDERTHFYFGKYHLSSVEKLLARNSKPIQLKTKAETDFKKAIEQPYGALIQFSGDRRGYAGILMPETTFLEVVHPFVTGSTGKASVRTHLWTLAEFATVMGGQLAAQAHGADIALHPSAPITYHGWGQPLKILGNPTYCYSCEIAGHQFYLAGDFRTPQEQAERVTPSGELSYHPNVVIQEARKQLESRFKQLKMPVTFSEISTQSELIGFDGGITSIVSCVSSDSGLPSHVLFLSYEGGLADYFGKGSADPQDKLTGNELDTYDVLKEESNKIGNALVAELAKRRIALNLSLPTLFVGKAYLSNFNRLFITNKIIGKTERGAFELQLLVTHLPE